MIKAPLPDIINKMITKNIKLKKFISTLLIISIISPAVLLSSPKKGHAFFEIVLDPTNLVQNTTSAVKDMKDWAVYLGQQLLKVVAQKILAQMTQATINWINSDFHGSPLFLENPDSFFGDIAKSELKTVVDMFGYDNVTYPFGKQFALNAINSYKRQLADNAGYTLRNVMNSSELQLYRDDFNYGGWNGFLTNTQYPQNNYLGFTILASDTLSGKLTGVYQTSAQRTQSLLQQGMGFLSPQTCKSNSDYNNGTNEFQKPSFHYDVPFTCSAESETEDYNNCRQNWEANKAKAKAEWAKTNECPGGLTNTTPGSVAANQIMTAMSSTYRQNELAAALGNSLSAIFDALINHFLDKGLNALSDTANPEPEEDNWSYDGNTLEGGDSGSGGSGTSGALNIPQNVSVNVKETTSTNITGGIAPYSIQPQSSESLAIAIATIDTSGSSGAKLKITAGNIPGTTSIVVEDSSSPAQTVTVTITVNALGALVIIPAKISTIVSDNPAVANIFGGKEPYYIKTAPSNATAIALIIGNSLLVTGRTDGFTFVDIKDSSAPIKTVRVNILVGPDVLIITPKDISVNVGQLTNLPISNGTPPFIITNQQNINVATAEILSATPSFVTITGRASGTTTATIQDSSNPAKTATITIQVF